MKAVFIGLGRMGSHMAKNMIDHGLSLGVYNRDPEKALPFQGLAQEVYPDLVSALKGADLLFTMVADDQALESILNDENMALMSPLGLHVSHSTVSPALIKRLSTKLIKSGREHLSAPVMGRPAAAASGSLKLLLAGSSSAKELARPYLEPLGEFFDFGEEPASSLNVKLAFNFMIVSLIETLSEAFSFVDKNSVDPRKFQELITATLFSAPAVKTYGELILKGDFDQAGFLLSLGAKDLNLVIDQSKSSKVPLPIAQIVENRFVRAKNRNWENKDWCVISELQREDSGLKKP
ncbi:MAG: NAD(P)-dependent oxidoreductase [Deltaproteobacteria bacterium]|jgi:3-hydroxyisobutyrate dehydrogenase-like beta-hydroxyacid dehydrogenase|nr:NAD(P)-dependent oxidoreductase [Deltaproteobacteria bacterium]